jgi:hypothetical protein
MQLDAKFTRKKSFGHEKTVFFFDTASETRLFPFASLKMKLWASTVRGGRAWPITTMAEAERSRTNTLRFSIWFCFSSRSMRTGRDRTSETAVSIGFAFRLLIFYKA